MSLRARRTRGRTAPVSDADACVWRDDNWRDDNLLLVLRALALLSSTRPLPLPVSTAPVAAEPRLIPSTRRGLRSAITTVLVDDDMRGSRCPRGCGHLNSLPSRARTTKLAPVVLSGLVRRARLLPLDISRRLPPPSALPPMPIIPVRCIPMDPFPLIASRGRVRAWLVLDRSNPEEALLGEGRARSVDCAEVTPEGMGSEFERIHRSMRVAILPEPAACARPVPRQLRV